MSEYKRLTKENGKYTTFWNIRLKEYEDIGLSPERIKQILDSRPLYRLEKDQVIVDKDAFNHCNELATAYSQIGSPEEFAELAKAKAEGRLVVLSTPMIPLVQSDDPMDSDVYCPACGNTLSGGWPDYHPDQEWTMCQCFYCGQSIDDTKVITRAEADAALNQIGGGHE